MVDIAIVGGGPKAVAIAAKADVLNRALGASFTIHVIERSGIGAAWTGGLGYTDGLQPLCTLAERDLGFPYSRDFGADVARETFARYSWHQFAVDTGKGGVQYDQWVLHGRKPPLHVDFASYLNDSLAKSGARHVHAEVQRIAYRGSSQPWELSWIEPSGRISSQLFDGVVLTGSGPPLPPLPGVAGSSNGRLFDGVSFWKNTAQVAKIVRAEQPADRSIAIVGGSGTAAAIAYWLIRNQIDVPTFIIGREPTLYARHPGYFEDRLFSESDDWKELSATSRDEFVRRLTVGVVWDYVLSKLDTQEVQYRCGDAQAVVIGTSPMSPIGWADPEVSLTIVPPTPRGATPVTGPTVSIPAAVVIDARGFDRWDFINLLDIGLKGYFTDRRAVEETISDGLTVRATDPARPTGGPIPDRLHAPMLASRQGPAATNLMALGWMADQILRYYLPSSLLAALRTP